MCRARQPVSHAPGLLARGFLGKRLWAFRDWGRVRLGLAGFGGELGEVLGDFLRAVFLWK